METDGMLSRMNALFAGRVQGVGFRFTVCQAAEQFSVTGYVRNLTGGDVEVIAEGSKQELLDFLNAIRESRMQRYIIREQVRWETATGRFDRFGISY